MYQKCSLCRRKQFIMFPQTKYTSELRNGHSLGYCNIYPVRPDLFVGKISSITHEQPQECIHSINIFNPYNFAVSASVKVIEV